NTMFKQAAPVGFESNELATADLVSGKVDAQVSDSTAAIHMAREDSRLAAMSPDNIFNPVYVAMLLRRDDQTMLNYINIWIDQIEMDGTLAKFAPNGWARRNSNPTASAALSSHCRLSCSRGSWTILR